MWISQQFTWPQYVTNERSLFKIMFRRYYALAGDLWGLGSVRYRAPHEIGTDTMVWFKTTDHASKKRRSFVRHHPYLGRALEKNILMKYSISTRNRIIGFRSYLRGYSVERVRSSLRFDLTFTLVACMVLHKRNKVNAILH